MMEDRGWRKEDEGQMMEDGEPGATIWGLPPSHPSSPPRAPLPARSRARSQPPGEAAGPQHLSNTEPGQLPLLQAVFE